MNKRDHTLFHFRLYVAGGTVNSALAQVNLKSLCQSHLKDRYLIDIVDVLREPKRALADGIFMTPTLVKLSPFPSRKLFGTLSQTQTVLLALGLDSVPL